MDDSKNYYDKLYELQNINYPNIEMSFNQGHLQQVLISNQADHINKGGDQNNSTDIKQQQQTIKKKVSITNDNNKPKIIKENTEQLKNSNNNDNDKQSMEIINKVIKHLAQTSNEISTQNQRVSPQLEAQYKQEKEQLIAQFGSIQNAFLQVTATFKLKRALNQQKMTDLLKLLHQLPFSIKDITKLQGQANIFNKQFLQTYIIDNIKRKNKDLKDYEIKNTLFYTVSEEVYKQMSTMMKLCLTLIVIWALILLGFTIPNFFIIDQVDDLENRENYFPSYFLKSILLIQLIFIGCILGLNFQGSRTYMIKYTFCAQIILYLQCPLGLIQFIFGLIAEPQKKGGVALTITQFLLTLILYIPLILIQNRAVDRMKRMLVLLNEQPVNILY